ncbi:MAG: pilus assembly PilX N-terminal domain-containing protein [Patescibacteria group bacterium]
MAAISKTKNRQGFVLITSVIIMGLILLLAIYVVGFIMTEMKISNSQMTSLQAYYLSESGIAEAIWRIKNDPTWKTNFETDPDWSVSYTRSNALYPNGSYQISINNYERARGQITVTSSIALGSSVAQRVVKTSVYKALGSSLVGDNAEFSDGNLDMSGTVLNVYNGSLFSNNNIIVNYWSVINVDNNVYAVGNVVKNTWSTINATETRDHDSTPPPTEIPLPAISFDNVNDANSYKSRADHIYTSSQFSDLMWQNPTLTLNGITYVTGDVEIKGPQTLNINGVLVADGNITVGKNTLFCCWGLRCGRSHLNMSSPSSTTPAGLLSKGRIDFELCLDDYVGTSLIYANDKINILSLPGQLNVRGGLISRKLTLTSLWQGVNIIFDNSVINYTLGNPQFSPIVTVEHWEEEY